MKQSSLDFSKNEKTILVLILSVSFLIKILLAFFLQAPFRSDSVDYSTLALSILNGEYSLGGKPTAYVGCGYPLFLSLIFFIFGEGQFYVRIIQSLLELGTCYFFYKVSLNFFTVKYSLLSLFILSFFPSNIIFSQAVLSESLFGFFSMVILYLLLRNDFPGKLYMIFVTGILFGYAVLIRTAFLPAAILIPLYFFYFRKDLFPLKMPSGVIKYSLIFLFGLILVVAPWSIRNKLSVGTYSLGTTAGVNFWAGSNPDATGTYYSDMNDNLPIDFSNESERDKEYFKLGLKYASENPLKFLILGVKKIGYLFSSERMAILYFIDHEPGQTSTEVYRSVNPLIIMLVNIPYFIIIFTGTWGLLALKEKRFFIYGFILMWVLTVFMFVALARYHYVLIPFFILGTVNVIVQEKYIFGQISFQKKIIGMGFSLFLIAVWITEFYLMIN
ncbi:MAG: glycosyltransferase family 39 protein [Ignavibacteria bacterium]|nr:glycosyltransferase family 39 protein [Ignavibacteria bacterium]